jgi:hypothetical protein
MPDSLPVLLLHQWRGVAVRPASMLSQATRLLTQPQPRKDFQHFFGGPLLHEELSVARIGKQVHRLFSFDAADPSLPVQLPCAAQLVLYYTFDPRVQSFGYRLCDDDSLDVFIEDRGDEPGEAQALPEEAHPAEFERTPVELKTLSIDPSDPEDAYYFSAFFGVAQLAAEMRSMVYQRANERSVELMGESLDPDDFWGSLDLAYMPQGCPLSECPNPQCRKRPMHTIGLVPASPVPQVSLWGEHGTDVVIIYELCPHCFAIRATNQCT